MSDYWNKIKRIEICKKCVQKLARSGVLLIYAVKVMISPHNDQ